ncbi:MAG: hypothetical protein DI569_03270 [Sphingopyxis macrogoltabida]|uniref:Calx-beta domain-containing protein n=1 Tax=Sphingopyxis macrogoltabida TaxID=33050 RepID=A0A2W5NBS9_SPHMC|nr:MAG: hypothetical protein DI569_03270 [Sphingopyxis macrogoltabida]
MTGIAARLAVTAGMMLALACPAMAQRVIVNPSFEANDPQGPGAPNYEIYPNGSVTGWNSASGEIELWDSNFGSVPAYEGSVFAEMNANVPGALYQNICMVNGEAIGWTFAHRARPGGPATQTARFQIATTGGTLLQNLATQSSTTANQVWNLNSGSTTYSGASGVQRVQFITTDAGSYGNFLDAIRITLNPFVELSAATGSGVESIAAANIPALRVNGTLFAGRTVSVSITGGTATRGSDYTTPGGGANFTVTIPAGSYQNDLIPLGIAIIDDALTEGSETIEMRLNAGTGYTLSSTQSCGGTPITNATYTITDNDSPVVLAKAWANGIVDDAVALTIAGGLAATAGSSTVGGSAANATAVATAGTTLTLAESFTAGDAANYISDLECRRNSDNALVATTGTGLSRSVVMPSGSSLTCTFTNSRRAATLVIRKRWVGAIVGHAVTVQASGIINDATLASVANSANETDTNTAVTVYAAEQATLGETFTVGSGASYAQLLACTGNAAALAGNILTVSPADTAIVCTFTNSFIRPLAITKTSAAFSDPVNGTANPKLIPGALATYTISVTAPAGTQPSADSVFVTDILPANLALFVGAYAPGPGPIRFTAGSSGLTYSFASLASASDDIAFSNNGGASFTYVPVPDADGVDANVTHVRINPKGSMAAGSNFTVNLRAQVK